MTALSFELKHGEKLEYTFDYTADMDAIGAAIDGAPVVTVLPASPPLTVSSVTLDVTVKKATVVITAPTSGEMEYTLSCKANATLTPDRDFVQGLIIRVRPPTPTAEGGLTTVGRVVAELGITDAAQQSLVSDQILEASAMIENYCNRTFAKQAGKVEKQSSNGGFSLMVDLTPLISVASITFDGVTVDSEQYSIHDEGAGIIYNPNGWNDTSVRGNGISQQPFLGSAEKLYTITYTGGYVLPGQPSRTLPRDVERACIELVKGIRSMREDASVKREEVPGVYSVEYADTSTEIGSIPGHVAKMLAPYRRILV